MNSQEARELTIEIWSYLRDHPSIANKGNLPQDLYEKIEDLECQCPLCDYFYTHEKTKKACTRCPLYDKDAGRNEKAFLIIACRGFRRWMYAPKCNLTSGDSERYKGAKEILDLIEKSSFGRKRMKKVL